MLLLICAIAFVFSQTNTRLETYAAARYHSLVYFSYCDEPIGFSLGGLDPKFNIDMQTFKNDVLAAAEIWNTAYGKTLFVHDPTAELDIHLVFDERQRLLSTLNNADSQISTASQDFEAQILAYEAQVVTLNAKIQALNAEIAEWNKKGGAPEDVYEKIIADQNRLRAEIARVDNEAAILAQTQSQLNEKIIGYNYTVDEFNTTLATKPEEGLYTSADEKIEIYFYDTRDRFVHTVAHELGHALGLDHVSNTQAIMHPTTSDALALSDEDFAALTARCAEINKVEFFYDALVGSVSRLVALQ